MENRIPISVIMLTYNRETMVSLMIESILQQSFKNFELIVIDNGSTDSSGEIAEKYAKHDNRIKVIHIEKSSIGKGRNIGLSQASGRYIAFVDDDDTCERTYLEELFLAVNSQPDVIAISGTNRLSNEISKSFTAREAMETLLDRKYFNVGFPTKLIPKSFFERNQFDENVKFDDIYLMPRMIVQANKIEFIAKPLYIVNRHDGNNSAWTTKHELLTKEILEEYINVYEKRTEWLCEIFPEEELLWKYYKWSFFISMLQKINIYKIENTKNITQKLLAELMENKDLFCNSDKIQDFEKEWMEEYVF